MSQRSPTSRGRKSAEAHHLRFAQSRALGRKVSDEFKGFPSAGYITANCIGTEMKLHGEQVPALIPYRSRWSCGAVHAFSPQSSVSLLCWPIC
jgi:hypothetical protein